MILKEGHGKVAMPDDSEGRTWECRKLASYEETEKWEIRRSVHSLFIMINLFETGNEIVYSSPNRKWNYQYVQNPVR